MSIKAMCGSDDAGNKGRAPYQSRIQSLDPVVFELKAIEKNNH